MFVFIFIPMETVHLLLFVDESIDRNGHSALIRLGTLVPLATSSFVTMLRWSGGERLDSSFTSCGGCVMRHDAMPDYYEIWLGGEEEEQ